MSGTWCPDCLLDGRTPDSLCSIVSKVCAAILLISEQDYYAPGHTGFQVADLDLEHTKDVRKAAHYMDLRRPDVFQL